MAECLQGWRRETLYHADADWIFPSIKEKGRIPRVASCCSQNHRRPAAVQAGVITADFAGRFGWHNLRHSLATFLATKVDIKMAQTILRHKKLSTTAEIYAHAVQQNQIAAQGHYLEATAEMTSMNARCAPWIAHHRKVPRA
jgi:integrase